MSQGNITSLAYKKLSQAPLRFRKDGTFRILHLSDIHEITPEMDTEDFSGALECSNATDRVILKCIEQTEPDLIVFGGDNISGYWKEFTYEYMRKTIKRIVAPVKERNIPLAVVFGNHDSEDEEERPFMRREHHVMVYSEYDNFRGCFNDADVYGCCNYVLPILCSAGDNVAWNVWCMDSNDYVRDGEHRVVEHGGYDKVHDDQIEWYEKRSDEIKRMHGDIPSVLFQHIPVREELQGVIMDDPNAEGAYLRDDKYYIAPVKGIVTDGAVREKPCPPAVPCKQFESWKRTGNIVAAFFGHDHVNSFTMEIDGIKLIQTIGAGFHTYGGAHGGRLIVLKENSRDFDTQTVIIEDEK